jgi:hypothetical protein
MMGLKSAIRQRMRRVSLPNVAMFTASHRGTFIAHCNAVTSKVWQSFKHRATASSLVADAYPPDYAHTFPSFLLKYQQDTASLIDKARRKVTAGHASVEYTQEKGTSASLLKFLQKRLGRRLLGHRPE